MKYIRAKRLGRARNIAPRGGHLCERTHEHGPGLLRGCCKTTYCTRDDRCAGSSVARVVTNNVKPTLLMERSPVRNRLFLDRVVDAADVCRVLAGEAVVSTARAVPLIQERIILCPGIDGRCPIAVPFTHGLRRNGALVVFCVGERR